MKKIMTLAASAAFAVLTMSSCATISTDAALAEKAPIGQKVGEAQSLYFLGLWSSQGEQNNLKKAAQNGSVNKVTQVEYITQSVFFGLFVKRTTRVYGE